MALLAFTPDLLYAGGRVRRGVSLVVRDGVVEGVGAPPEGATRVGGARTAILPGMVLAHSHAFQRAIRGRTEHRSGPRDPANFWSWREAMYAAAETLSPEEVGAVARMCFLEMALAGVTAVGEFHYLHRDRTGRPYADPNEISLAVIRAARDVGLRIVLLRVHYARAGHRVAENPRQKRFIEPIEEYLAGVDALAAAVRDDPFTSVGAAPHSVRACPAEEITQVAAHARARGWPLHLHVAEQPGEVEQCLAEHGTTPARLLERIGALGEGTTAVHAVHLTPEDIAALGKARAHVCACPTTERNLGDGIIAAAELLDAGARLAVGSDSEAQIAPLEEARQLEYHLRLQKLGRAVLDPGGEPRMQALGMRLYGFASAGGMASLGLPGGDLSPGEPADLVVVSLDDPSIAGCGQDDLVPAVVFGMDRSAVREVWVGGQPIVREGQALARGARGGARGVIGDFDRVMARLWGPR